VCDVTTRQPIDAKKSKVARVAENRSELDDRLGQAIRQKPGSKRSQRVFYERTFDRRGAKLRYRQGKVYNTDRLRVPSADW